MLSRRGARGVAKAELSDEADSENNLGGSSETICITSDWMFTRRQSAIALRTRLVVCTRKGRCAGCQVPQMTGRATEATPEALFVLFRDWQRIQTQSSAPAPRSPRQQMDVRFCRVQEPTAERQTCAVAAPDRTNNALSRARTEGSCFSVDKDLHGSR